VPAHWRLGVFEFKLDRRNAPRRVALDEDSQARSPWINAPNLRSFLCASGVPKQSTREALDLLASYGDYEELTVLYLNYKREDVDFLLSKHTQRPIFPNLKYFGA
jgi:hypothetical protein